MKTKSVVPALLLITLILIGIALLLQTGNKPAPDVIFTTITGERIALKKLQGQPVLVTFWATSCRSCVREIPHLKQLYQDYQKQGLHIIAVAMYYDPPNRVVKMARERQLPYNVALDLQMQHAKAFYDVRLTPTTFLIAPDGTIAFHKIGTFDIQDMENRIESFLKG